MALISLRDITMSFGDRPVLDGIDLQIEAGERLCLLGLNGCGKTTLMKIVAGELEPLEGDIQQTQGLQTSILDQKVPDSIKGTLTQKVVSVLQIVSIGKEGLFVYEISTV